MFPKIKIKKHTTGARGYTFELFSQSILLYLSLFWTILSYLVASQSISDYPGLSYTIRDYLGLFRTIWDYP